MYINTVLSLYGNILVSSNQVSRIDISWLKSNCQIFPKNMSDFFFFTVCLSVGKKVVQIHNMITHLTLKIKVIPIVNSVEFTKFHSWSSVWNFSLKHVWQNRAKYRHWMTLLLVVIFPLLFLTLFYIPNFHVCWLRYVISLSSMIRFWG